jgi:hypothetical protein
MIPRLFALLLIYAIAALVWALHISWAADSAQPVIPVLAVLFLSAFIVFHDGED